MGITLFVSRCFSVYAACCEDKHEVISLWKNDAPLKTAAIQGNNLLIRFIISVQPLEL